MTSDPIDAEVIDEEPASRELVTVPTLTVTPQVDAAELVSRLNVIREAMNTAMEKDVDYGVIPGTNKPTLLKPGAEKLSVLFQLDVQLDNEKTWGPDDHLTVVSHATVYHAPSGARLGYGEGVCTTRERKYAYRQQQRTCPSCNATAVIKGKKEYGGGWLCFAKKGGCGAKWNDGNPVIEGQETGEVQNPDLPDLWNTVVKMAEKRARVDAVLAVSGASALFTQDAEDLAQAESKPAEPNPSRRAPGGATKDQVDWVRALLKGKKVSEIRWYMEAVGITGVLGRNVNEKIEGLDPITASRLIEVLEHKLPATSEPDVPEPVDGDFEHESQPPLDLIA